MKIALIGYGKMGKAIERLALEKGHEITCKIDIDNQAEIRDLNSKVADAAIEFSRPDSAFYNVSGALRNGVPIISGTTGWLDRLPQIEQLVKEENGTFLYASNFSYGVNVFFQINKLLSKHTANRGFDVEIEETHHTEKLDAPSGTAITLAEGVIQEWPEKSNWVNKKTSDENKISIESVRESNVPGTHIVQFSNQDEMIEIKHIAHSRDIFAAGAIEVAEWIADKKGFLTMSDYLNH